jgi:hypothetical protein
LVPAASARQVLMFMRSEIIDNSFISAVTSRWSVLNGYSGFGHADAAGAVHAVHHQFITL